MFFIAYPSVILIIFAVAFVFAARALSKLRNTSAIYNPRLLPFAYFSLSSWILWALQYVILVGGPFTSVPSGLFQNVGLWLGVMQNALWITAVLSLHSKQFSKVSRILPLLIMFSIVIGLVTYQTEILTSESFASIDALSTATIFLTFAYSISKLRLSKISAATFLIHGYSQWIWRSLWLTPLDEVPIALLVAFSLWHIALLVAWINLISEMLVTIRVMISSTIKDLAQERAAAERAVRGLHLDGFRSETFGSLPDTPQAICALWAEQCDIFILLIGKVYGHKIELRKSIVEFEFDVAYEQDPGKILVYVKDGVNRDAELTKFMERVQDFKRGYFRSLFTTPEDLYKKIQHDVVRCLTSRARQNNQD